MPFFFLLRVASVSLLVFFLSSFKWIHTFGTFYTSRTHNNAKFKSQTKKTRWLRFFFLLIVSVRYQNLISLHVKLHLKLNCCDSIRNHHLNGQRKVVLMRMDCFLCTYTHTHNTPFVLRFVSLGAHCKRRRRPVCTSIKLIKYHTLHVTDAIAKMQ